MEKAPEGTFQDELEWCIRQLETGLLHQNPTPEQVGDAQRILKVLRSPKAPFVKKRQVMSQVFGDYRQRMAVERRKAEETAMKLSSKLIQEGDGQKSCSVSYRKCSGESSEKVKNWFSPSDNSFMFSFTPCEEGLQDIPTKIDNSQSGRSAEDGEAASSESSFDHKEHVTPSLNWTATGNSVSGFTFNFSVPEEAEGQEVEFMVKEGTSSSCPSMECEGTSTEGNILKEQAPLEKKKELPVSETSIAALKHDEQAENVNELISKNYKNCEQQKQVNELITKKKKKKQMAKKSKETEHATVRQEGKVASTEEQAKTAHQSEEGTQGDEQLQKEVDWCIEQLQLGLKRPKTTQKQADEVLRAVKILRSEKTALVKKRQIMRTMLGDYRKKMEEERGKQLQLLLAATKSARVAEVRMEARKSSSFVYRKCREKTQNHMPATRLQGMSAPLVESTSQVQQGAEAINDSDLIGFTSSKDQFCFNFF